MPTSVTLEQEGGILNKGMTWTLHATVLPEDAADKTLHWTSSDEGVATIDDNGIITALAPGPDDHHRRQHGGRGVHHLQPRRAGGRQVQLLRA